MAAPKYVYDAARYGYCERLGEGRSYNFLPIRMGKSNIPVVKRKKPMVFTKVSFWSLRGLK